MVRISVVYVDSAIRWRRNDAGGFYKEIVVCGRLFDRRFLSFCGFAIRRVARAAALRRGGSPLRLSPGVLRRLRTLCSERAQVVSSQTLLRSALCCFRAEASGASICEPPRGGASARTAKAGFYEFGLHLKLAHSRTIRTAIPIFHPALPPVAYSSLPRSLRIMNSLVPTRCADRSSSRFVILRSRATKNLYGQYTDV